MCITKLVVLDGLETIRICTGYRLNGSSIDTPPAGADLIEQCEPEYIEMPGWSESTVGAKTLDDLPQEVSGTRKKILKIAKDPFKRLMAEVPRDYAQLKRRRNELQELSGIYAQELEDRFVDYVLSQTEGNISRAARLAKKDRKDFYDVIRRTGVDPSDFR